MKFLRFRAIWAVAGLTLLTPFFARSGGVQARMQPLPAASPASAGSAARGKAIYESRCVECHGLTGRGDGPAAAHLTPRPRNFADGKYKIRTTETGSLPTDEDLLQSVGQGLYSTTMPAWRSILSDSDIRDVVAYIKTLSPRFAGEAPRPIVPGPQIASSPQSVGRGREVYDKLQCGKCHGSDGRGANAVTTQFEDDWRQPLRAADLTEPWTFHGGATARDIYLRFRTGMSGTPMPSFAEAATDAEMWDLANYVMSLGRTPVWSMSADEVREFYARQDQDARANPVRRGSYLVDTLACALCHSPLDEQRRVLPGMRLAGGLLIRVEPFGDYPTGNLTSDQESGLGRWTDDEIKRAMTKGILRDGTRLLPYPMDYASYSTLKPEDLDAIVAYLRTVPPVINRVPAPTRKFLPVYLWGKFNMLMLGGDPPMIFLPGNAGTAGTVVNPTVKKLLKWTMMTIVAVAIGAFVAFLYLMPPFLITPPETFGKAMADAAPGVEGIADPVARAIAERGRYIVMTSGCTGCHATNGPQGPDLTKYLAGGALMIRNESGTYVSRNLTPDAETGLARRTDDEVKRVLRSGTFPDGHVVPYTTMPWAAFANWSEEDRHAVLVYLRNLKPVKHRIPDPVFGNAMTVPGAIETDYGMKDYGK